MGGKGSKNKPAQSGNASNAAQVKPLAIKTPELTEADYAFLTTQTGSSRADIKSIFDQFNQNNPDGKLDRQEFARLYNKLRPEPPELLDEISNFVFNSFDSDHNGSITFSEFMIAYSLTSRGGNLVSKYHLKKKLEYAFNLYDADNSGNLDTNEVRAVLTAMLDLLGAEKRNHNIHQLTEECIKQLDSSGDGKISKSEFIDGLMANYSLRALMSPFN